MAVQLTEEQKQNPLYKYYELPIDPVPKDLFEKIMQMKFDTEGGMNYSDLDTMFDDGYLTNEFGLYTTPDGGLMVSNLTDMPGVTPEMFDWWFAWHGLDSMRYIIWDKDDHYYCQTQNVEQALDSSLSFKERYWFTEHKIKEALVDNQPPRDIHLKFVPPVKMGYDPDKLAAFKGTIVCTLEPAIMIHFLRPTDHGSELRTRFFMAYLPTPEGVVRAPLPPRLAENADEIGRTLLLHNVKEYRHLATVLPDLYNEYKDNFTVGLK